MNIDKHIQELEHLITRKQNAKLIGALRHIKHMVDTSKGSEGVTCLALQDYIVRALEDAGVKPPLKPKSGASDAKHT